MIFQLTADLEDKILHALEDQGQEFLVESESSSLVPACSVVADEDNYYSLPRWDSSDGFSLRENFAISYRSSRRCDHQTTRLLVLHCANRSEPSAECCLLFAKYRLTERSSLCRCSR